MIENAKGTRGVTSFFFFIFSFFSLFFPFEGTFNICNIYETRSPFLFLSFPPAEFRKNRLYRETGDNDGREKKIRNTLFIVRAYYVRNWRNDVKFAE